MAGKFASWLIAFIFFLTLIHPFPASAANQDTSSLSKANSYIGEALAAAKHGDLEQAKDTYGKFHDTWFKIEDDIKKQSGKAYSDIESNMGQVEYAFTGNKQQDIVQALESLQNVNANFIEGKYPQGAQFKQENISLADFIGLLQQTQAEALNRNLEAALADIARARQSWLSVEGIVVAQSATVYSDSERDMVTINAMLSAQPPNFQGAAELTGNMIRYLSPLANKSHYTMWDAALIPIREGLEALLVVAALLAYVNRSDNRNHTGKRWIWLGVSTGLFLSTVLAVIVKFVFASGAFGNNNFLISGWTGVVAAAMLLYMSYWLHNQSMISDWNRYIRSKSQTALDTGRMVSLGILSFLAIFREGTETVLFLIGMVNQIRLQSLIAGMLIGIGVLLLLAYLMLVAGLKLPMRPFFMVSSLIVFYLCLKFTGMGIHSLQLAGLVPSTAAGLPSIDLIALYPTWQSAIPQILLVLSAAAVLVWNQWKKNQAAKTPLYK